MCINQNAFIFLQFNLSPSCSSVFLFLTLFSPPLLGTVKVYVCFAYTRRFAPFVDVVVVVCCFDLLYFSAKFSIFTSDALSRSRLLLLLIVVSPILRMIYR